MYPKLKEYQYNFTHELKQIDKNKDTDTLKVNLNTIKKYIDTYYKTQEDTEKITNIINLIDPFKQYKYTLKTDYNIQLSSSTWLSIWEVLSNFKLIPSYIRDQTYICFFNDSFGSYISSVNHYIKSMTSIKSFVWYACGNQNTLQQSYPTRWLNDSQINSDSIERINTSLSDKIDLYISDIPSNCKDYTLQEEYHMKNNIGQVLLGLKILNNGGTMIIKMYTLFLSDTKKLLTILNKCFSKIIAYKPFCTKAINGDIFIICTSYNQIIGNRYINILNGLLNSTSGTLFDNLDIDYDVELTDHKFYTQQITVFENLIKLFDTIKKENLSDSDYNTIIKKLKNEYKKEHIEITTEWISKYPINSLKYKDKLLIK